jgi:hypothetical protein
LQGLGIPFGSWSIAFKHEADKLCHYLQKKMSAIRILIPYQPVFRNEDKVLQLFGEVEEPIKLGDLLMG